MRDLFLILKSSSTAVAVLVRETELPPVQKCLLGGGAATLPGTALTFKIINESDAMKLTSNVDLPGTVINDMPIPFSGVFHK